MAFKAEKIMTLSQLGHQEVNLQYPSVMLQLVVIQFLWPNVMPLNNNKVI